MRSFIDPIVYTHLLFVCNVILYVYTGFYLLGLVLFWNCVASYFYHRSNETNRFWKRADYIFCIISLILIFTYLISNASWLQVISCVIWLLFSLIIYKLGNVNYTFFHSLWHWFVFGGNVLVWYVLGGERI